MLDSIPSRRWSTGIGTGKSAELRSFVVQAAAAGVRPIAYLPTATDVGLRTERVDLPDAGVAECLGAAELSGRLVRHLSSGERQRVRLASALSGSIGLAALDEPCRHLDPEHAEALGALLSRRATGGMGLAVCDSRRLLRSELFAQETGETGEACEAPEPAAPSTADPLELEVPVPFVRSATGRATDKVATRIARGSLIVVRGPNGGGKTSLLEALAKSARAAHVRFGISRQDPEQQLFAATPERELQGVMDAHSGSPWSVGADGAGQGSDAAHRVLAQLGLERWFARPTPRVPLGVASLAGAMIALWMGHDLVLLDEPTQGLDTRAARVLGAELVRSARAGARVVVATHDAEIVRIANESWRVEAGTLSQGAVS